MGDPVVKTEVGAAEVLSEDQQTYEEYECRPDARKPSSPLGRWIPTANEERPAQQEEDEAGDRGHRGEIVPKAGDDRATGRPVPQGQEGNGNRDDRASLRDAPEERAHPLLIP
jgi:hypothetical protein